MCFRRKKEWRNFWKIMQIMKIVEQMSLPERKKIRIEFTINRDIIMAVVHEIYLVFQLICLAYKTKIEESTLPFSIGRYFLFSFIPLSRLYMCCAYFILFPLLFNSKWNSNGYLKCFLMFDIFISSYYVSIHLLIIIIIEWWFSISILRLNLLIQILFHRCFLSCSYSS